MLHKNWKTWALVVLFGMALFLGCAGPKEEVTSTVVPTTSAQAMPLPPGEKATPTVVLNTSAVSEWKGVVSEANLVEVVNFLISNNGKEIELAGKKHIITGKEELDVVVRMLHCCTLTEFRGLVNSISVNGKIRDSDFKGRVIYASVPADEIAKIDKVWNVERIEFESEARDFWMQVIGRGK